MKEKLDELLHGKSNNIVIDKYLYLLSTEKVEEYGFIVQSVEEAV